MRAVDLEADRSSCAPRTLTPRERLEALCDPGTLRVFRTGVASRRLDGRAPPGDGVLAGVGAVGDRRVFCYAQDGDFAGGAVGEVQADTIVRLLRLARGSRAPVVGFLESAGARIQEGVAALGGYGRIFRETVALSRVAPHISVICGTSAGGGSYAPALTDFVIMVDGARMFLTGPAVVREAVGEDLTPEALGGRDVHERNGLCHLNAASDGEAAALARDLLVHLPPTATTRPRPAPPAPPLRPDPGTALPVEPRRAYDVRAVLDGIVDRGSLLEVSPKWARSILTAFARLGGRRLAVLANQPRHLGGLLNVESSQKAAWFVRRCDTLGMPLLVVVDTPGFMPGSKEERAGIIRHGADLVRAFAAATVPRVTLVTRKAFGGAYIAMNSKDLGADFAFAWPGAEIGIMGALQAVRIVDRRRLAAGAGVDELADAYRAKHLTAGSAAREGVIDEVIEPAGSRACLQWAFAALEDAGWPSLPASGDRDLTLHAPLDHAPSDVRSRDAEISRDDDRADARDHGLSPRPARA